MYKDEYHPRVKRDLKKLDVQTREEIKTTHEHTAFPLQQFPPALGLNKLPRSHMIDTFTLVVAAELK